MQNAISEKPFCGKRNNRAATKSAPLPVVCCPTDHHNSYRISVCIYYKYNIVVL